MSYPAKQPPFVTQRASSFHHEIDLSLLAKTLAEVPIPREARSRIVGPYDLHVFEQRRKQQHVYGAEAKPSDYFIWASGEPSNRAMTKLGGIPYMPASLSWPHREGTAGDFYAQLNFMDSREILPALPGDVLLVFRFHDLDKYTSWDEGLYGFVWVAVHEQDLIRPEDVQRSKIDATGNPWPVMHGYRVRTFDNPGQIDRLRLDDSLDASLHTGEATKIGGAATDCQSIWPPEVPSDYQFIGQITSVWPPANVPFPMVDRAAPVSVSPDPAYKRLMSGPGDGVTSLYLDAHGSVRVHFSCS